MTTWYNQCMPKIKEVAPYIYILFRELKKSEQIKGIYVWGSYSKNIDKPNLRIKDLDIIARTKLNSQDLIAIDNDIINNYCSNKWLENQGYDPLSVKFSKTFINIKKYNIDHWAISDDRKLLHWGPVPENKKESEEMKKLAETHAYNITGFSKSKINYSSNRNRKNWYYLYCDYINKYFKGMPTGWYRVEDMKIKDILKNAIKI